MWKDKYRIGVPLIDEQHKELFQRVSNFIVSVQREGDWDTKLDEVKKTLTFMQNYVVTHFEDEEEYQRSIGFPGYEKHKEIHSRFRAGVEDYARKMQTIGYTQELVQEFAGKLMAWLINHVGRMDQEIGAFARSQGGSSDES
ncbi:MAG: bacteriohemerythrin [Limnochordia bacterium]